MDCIFCKIINGDIPSYTIYEDEKVKAFMDINPVSNGHTLIIPKKHFENIYDMDIETLAHIEKTGQKLAEMIKEKLHCHGITRMQNNEYGQDVKHYHMHLIPRYEGDKFELKMDKDNISEVGEIFKKLS